MYESKSKFLFNLVAAENWKSFAISANTCSITLSGCAMPKDMKIIEKCVQVTDKVRMLPSYGKFIAGSPKQIYEVQDLK